MGSTGVGVFHPFTHRDVTRGWRQLLSLHPRPDTVESIAEERRKGQLVCLVSSRGIKMHRAESVSQSMPQL